MGTKWNGNEEELVSRYGGKEALVRSYHDKTRGAVGKDTEKKIS